MAKLRKRRLGNATAPVDPRSLSPMVPVISSLPVDEQNWGFEFKWDGYRALCVIDSEGVRFLSRRSIDLTATFPELQRVRSSLGKHTAILDGEIVVIGEDHRPNFSLIQKRMRTRSDSIQRLMKTVPATYMVFDILMLDDQWLIDRPYTERRNHLDSLAFGNRYCCLSEFVVGDGKKMLLDAERMGLEGVVAKRLKSPYLMGKHSSDWRKIKILQRESFWIGGWAFEECSRRRIGALLLGRHDDRGDLRFVGTVGTGFKDADHEELLVKLQPLVQDRTPFTGAIDRRLKPRFVRPKLKADIAYLEWTGHGVLRHASFKGLTKDS